MGDLDRLAKKHDLAVKLTAMEINLISFGKIAEFVEPQVLTIAATDTDELKIYIEDLFPELKNLKYKMALNQQLIQSNTTISDRSTLALLPPFSGG